MNDVAAQSARKAEQALVDTPPRRFKLTPFDEIRLAIARAYLIKGLVPRNALVAIWGPPKCGKSFSAFDLAMHVALGREYRGRRVHAGAVVYVACEGERGLGARVEAFRQERMAEDHDPPPFYLICTALDLIGKHGQLADDIRAQVGETAPEMIVIDTLNRSIRGKESGDGPDDMPGYVKAAEALQREFGCTVILIHHCGIDSTRPRGHTSLRGSVDAEISVKRDGNGLIVVKLSHAKDMPEGETITSRLKVVEVGQDEDGAPITSCVIEPADDEALSEKARPKITGNTKVVLELIRKALNEYGREPPASNHIPSGTKKVVPVDLARDTVYTGLPGERDKSGTKRKTFNRAFTALQNAHILGIWDEKIWLNE